MAGLMVAIANSISSNYVVSAGGGFDPNAEAFITAAGITNPTQQNAINDLVLDLKAASIWTKFNALYPIVGGTAASHKFNLKNPLDTDAAFRLVFSTGWTHSSTGMLPNGTSSYADTFLTPSTNLSLNNTHLSYYSRSDINILNQYEIGSSSLSGVAQYCLLILRDNNLMYSAINVAQGNAASSSNTDSRGLFIANRTASNILNGFRNSTKLINSTNASSVLPTAKISIGALNNNGTIGFYSQKQCAFSSIGTGLTDTESQVFYQIVEKYQVALGRNINPTQSFYYNRNYNNETNAFLFATQITDTTQQAAVNTLVDDFKSAGIWTKMKSVYPIVGGTAATHAVNLSAPGTYNLTFSTGWTHATTGMTGNGSSSYADTSLIPNSVLSLNSTHISAYTRSNILIDAPLLSSENATTYANGLYIWAKQTGAPNNSSVRINDNTSDVVAAPADIRGLHLATRTASNVKKYRLNNTQQFSVTSSSTALNTSSIYIGASRNNPNYNSSQIAFSSIGDGLTDLEAQLFYQIVEKYQVALSRNVNPTQSFYYNTSYNPETNAFLFNTGITDATTISATDTLVTTLKTQGIWTKMKAVYPIVGGTAATHKFNLVNPVDTNEAYRLTFATGWTHSSTGMLPNGTSSFANTFFIPSTNLTDSNNHLSYYSRTDAVAANVCEVGSYNNAIPAFQFFGMQIKYTGNLFLCANGVSPYPTVSNTNSQGFYLMTKNGSSTQLNAFRNATKVITNGITGIGISTTNVYIGAFNNNGTASNYTTKQCAFSSIGTGLTDTDVSNLYTAVQAFQTTLGRQV